MRDNLKALEDENEALRGVNTALRSKHAALEQSKTYEMSRLFIDAVKNPVRLLKLPMRVIALHRRRGPEG